MSYKFNYQGPFIKKLYSSTYGGGRGSDNPATGVAFSETIPVGLKRISLTIQNATTAEVDITFGDANAVALKLYAGQTVSFDNFHSGFTSSSNAVKIFEAYD